MARSVRIGETGIHIHVYDFYVFILAFLFVLN
jgi:hypothetical protein